MGTQIMNREPELSIIVPVYNVEEYLEDCVRSILNQTYQDYEIILIDDGSTDSSGQICDSFTDERIRVFHIKNGGVSNARNLGLAEAKGRYITFIDSDDMYGDNDTLENNIKILNTCPEIEIIQFPTFLLIYDQQKEYHSPKPIILKDLDVFKGWYKGSDYFNYTCWNKIYRRQILNDLEFPIIKNAEDVLFLSNLMTKTSCVSTSLNGRYLYRVRKGSTTQSERCDPSINYNNLYAFSHIYEISTRYIELKRDCLSYFIFLYIWYMELKTLHTTFDYTTIKNRLHANKLSYKDAIWYLFHCNKIIDSQYKPRYRIHLLLYFIGGKFYEWFYCTVLRLEMKRR